MQSFLRRAALMLGNIVIGLSVLAPTGMLVELADGLHVGITDAGLLVTYGAVVLCIGSPLVAWLTAHVDRRLLLGGSLALVTIGQAASALAPNYAILLVVRLLMLAAAAVYTPQAAATAAMIVPERQRASAIAFVFLGWTLTIAAGLPLVTLLATHFGWRATYGALALFSLGVTLLLFTALPSGLEGRAMPLAGFTAIVRNKRILLILLLTLLQTSGQFTVFVYLAPLLTRLAGAGPAIIGMFFACYGVAGLFGNVTASASVTSLGIQRTLALFLGATFIGLILWSVGAGLLIAMGAGMAFWGFGFAATNSMQQARLAQAAPDFAGVAISFNTSVLYTGQAVGSGIGGILFAAGLLHVMGYAGVAFVAAACLLLALTWVREAPLAQASSAP
jgi:MFS transporter, DHA1 family, inner membrane transport protein